jgi:hypothetical protein
MNMNVHPEIDEFSVVEKQVSRWYHRQRIISRVQLEAAYLTHLLVYLPPQYGTFINQEVTTCTASNSEPEVPTAAWLKVFTFIHGELCLRIPLFYSQRFSAIIGPADASLEEGGANLEPAHGFQGLSYGEKITSSFCTQVDSRWYSFVERCRQEWLDIHAFSTLTAG